MTPAQTTALQSPPSISPEAWKLVIPLLLISLAMAFLFWQTSLLLLAICVVLMICFRNPKRAIYKSPGTLLSPSDATVTEVRVQKSERFASGQMRSIRLQVRFNQVAVQRAPFDCWVEDLERPKKGKRSVIIWLKSDNGQLVGLQFIPTGVFSKVFCPVKIGDRFRQGDRMGIVPFGARVNVYVDSEVDLRLDFGSRLVAGQSPLVVFPRD